MNSKQHQLLLADDDTDDCLFFKEALEELQIVNTLQTVTDGAELMNYSSSNRNPLPHILFLDLNMPRKNGLEGLYEIKSNDKLQQLPVVIISTSLNIEMVNLVYQEGVHYYIRKPGEFSKLKNVVHEALTRTSQNSSQPARADFVLQS